MGREKRIVLAGSGFGVVGAAGAATAAQPILPGADPISGVAPGAVRHRIFLLSPANASGARARLLLNSGMNGACTTRLGLRLRNGSVRLGELFSFMSALYFRGKLTYAQRFAAPPGDLPGVLVITPSRGLLPPEQVVTLADLEEMTRGQVDLAEMRYREPLERDARKLLAGMEAAAGGATEVVLLGSVATPKYVEPLGAIFGARLVFPAEFLGLGDMSRGGLLLKCTREAEELKYVAVVAPRKGAAAQPGGKKNSGSARAGKAAKADGAARDRGKKR